MTFPLEIKLGNLSVSLHLLFEALGFIVGFRYYLYLRRKQTDPISDSNRMIILIGATFGAFLFSRLVGALEHPDSLMHARHPILYLYANKTIVGALLGGLLVVEIVKKVIHEKASSGDLFTYPLILAMMIGRIGCFTSGVTEETYGIETNSFLGMDLGDGLHRHPVALYEIAFLGLLWIALVYAEKRVHFGNGFRFQLFMISYLSFRFLLDFIKPHYPYILGLGIIQLCCLAGLIYYAQLYILRSHDQPVYRMPQATERQDHFRGRKCIPDQDL